MAQQEVNQEQLVVAELKNKIIYKLKTNQKPKNKYYEEYF